MRTLIVVCAVSVALVGCSSDEPIDVELPEGPPNISQADLDAALLRAADLGEGWEATTDPQHSTVQIGGRFGPANIEEPLAESVSSFTEPGDSGAVSNSVFVMHDEDLARSVVAIHEASATTSSWSQERTDEGTATFELIESIPELDDLGDERFTAKLSVEITAEGDTTPRELQYVVYRIGPLVGFVISQDTPVIPHARRQAARVGRLAA